VDRVGDRSPSWCYKFLIYSITVTGSTHLPQFQLLVLVPTKYHAAALIVLLQSVALSNRVAQFPSHPTQTSTNDINNGIYSTDFMEVNLL